MRARLRDRASHQKAVLALSILSVLMVSVLSNQWLTRPQQQEMAGRGIASFQPVSSTTDLKWEHRLARELSEPRGLAAHLAEKPSLRDELIFGHLEGRYAMNLEGDRIRSIEFIQTGYADEPLVVKDRAALLAKYHSLFAIPFKEVSFKESSDGSEVWSLIASDKTIVGTAHVSLDVAGRFLALKIQK